MGTDKIKLTDNAKVVLKKRYLAKDTEGNVIETPEAFVERVSRAIAQAEENYSKGKAKDWAKNFINRWQI